MAGGRWADIAGGCSAHIGIVDIGIVQLAGLSWRLGIQCFESAGGCPGMEGDCIVVGRRWARGWERVARQTMFMGR